MASSPQVPVDDDGGDDDDDDDDVRHSTKSDPVASTLINPMAAAQSTFTTASDGRPCECRPSHLQGLNYTDKR
jgi:hypothetical protein